MGDKNSVALSRGRAENGSRHHLAKRQAWVVMGGPCTGQRLVPAGFGPAG